MDKRQAMRDWLLNPQLTSAVAAVIKKYGIDNFGAKAVIPDGGWSPEILANGFVTYSNYFKVDLSMMLAQGIAECHFGCNPAASKSRRTFNIFNVGNTDSGAEEVQNGWVDGIRRYARVMASEYNYHDDPEGWVMMESMVSHKFTRPRGGVYSTTKDYEKLVSVLAMKIRKLLTPNPSLVPKEGSKNA